ncbi:MAG: outer membrane beta-barrel protein [Myxococcota bacterium]|jgi:hypothetical protein|nr:outer membrane beta-barrel protein [Myxococcota bacterium]
MKKLAVIVALGFGFMFAGMQNADAKDLTGRFGVGADSSLGWGGISSGSLGSTIENKGIAVTYYVSKMFGLQLLAMFDITSSSYEAGTEDIDWSANRWGISVRGVVPIAFTNDVNLGLLVGINIMGAGTDNGDDDDNNDLSAIFLSFDLGLRPEWFITEHFSIHTQVGVAISLFNEDNISFAMGGEMPEASGVDLNFFGNPDFIGQAGFTFWF